MRYVPERVGLENDEIHALDKRIPGPHTDKKKSK
jgi:hypothetical protein